MRSDEICALLLRTCKAEGVSDVVASVTESENAMLRFSSSSIDIANALSDTTVSVFVADSGRKAGISVADLSRRGLEKAARNVVASAKKGPSGDPFVLPKGPFSYDPALLSSEPITTDPKKLMAHVKIAIDEARAQGIERVAGSLIADNSKVTMQTSGDAFASAKKSTIELSLRAFLTSTASGHSVIIAGREADFDAAGAGREAGKLAKLAADPVNIEPGAYQAVLGPQVFASLISQTGRMASAFSVEAGFSFLENKIGEPVASEAITLCDDATAVGTYGSFPFDAEGLPTRRKCIIEKGILRTYLHNSSTATKFGVESTANAGLVAPSPFSLVVEPGSKTVDELISSVDNGIYVTNDWYLRYQNYRTGDFSTIPRDAMFLIKDGKIERSVKELRISDNMLGALKRVTALSAERKWIKWWEVEVPTHSPTALLRELKFTRSRM
ncbi:MAG TPA: TldD/PmbA family protein [Methanomassiliicoccales archaeon]|nr:TldD/PmbA family protein [Methanomassiliicoccales archaeon]